MGTEAQSSCSGYRMHFRVIPAKGAGSPSILVSHLLRAALRNINSSDILAYSGCTRNGFQWPKEVLRCRVMGLATVGGSRGCPALSMTGDGQSNDSSCLPSTPSSYLRPLEVRSSFVGGERGVETPSWETKESHSMEASHMQ